MNLFDTLLHVHPNHQLLLLDGGGHGEKLALDYFSRTDSDTGLLQEFIHSGLLACLFIYTFIYFKVAL